MMWKGNRRDLTLDECHLTYEGVAGDTSNRKDELLVQPPLETRGECM